MTIKKPVPDASVQTIATTLSSAESPPSGLFPVVGIGASAGGLAAFEAFFSGMPANENPGMAFILVQHLAPDHKSILTELIRRYTPMKVFEVEDGMKVQANCAYIIPPNRDMAYLNGTLQLLEPAAPRGHRLPIDFFFRSLAHNLHERAIGIVLSGTGSDGMLGVRAIKGEGGMIMAQTPESTEFDGMPRSAISTGLVDFELLPAEMGAHLTSYAAHAFGKLPHIIASATPKSESTINKIFILLRAQTGHDFSLYKPNTIHRRLERRMAVNRIESLENYLKYLQSMPGEVEALFRDLLIGVTNFFRDADAFQALQEEVIPQLFANKSAGSVIRVWTPGCSTGEESYSIAILLHEHMEMLRQHFTLQVFATDIDSRAISTARAGLYPASISSDISAERLARFFTLELGGGQYRIHKNIRDLLIFSEQNVIKDPPFSRLDLISCRNLLIYLGSELQKKLIPLFHYALKPDGMLFLGSSEGVGDFSDLFCVINRKAKLYQRNEDFHSMQRATIGRIISTVSTVPKTKPILSSKLPLRELTEQALLQQAVPAGALVNEQGDILYLHGRTGMFLEMPSGETGINNILKMAREGLRIDLTIALRKAAASRNSVRCPNLNVKTNGHFTRVNLTVRLVTNKTASETEAPLFLVTLDEAAGMYTGQISASTVIGNESDKATESNSYPDTDARIAALKQELIAKDEYLHSTHEELETSNEELKSSNEEMQSVNEELQSTNEELETSKEELQSVNEELATVNNELQIKVADLSQANNDMNNLLAGTGIATIFVDHQLHILRFTPSSSAIINLISSDMGRPIGHISSNLTDYDSLVTDICSVLDSLVCKEVDVQTTKGEWFRLRIQPYRTLENVIEGAVITFVNISSIKRAEAEISKADELTRLAAVVRDSNDAITVQNLDGKTLAWNPGATRIYGWSESDALRMNVRDRIPEALREEALLKLHQLSLSETLEPYQTLRISKNGSIIAVWMTATALVNDTGLMYAIATTERAKT